MNTFNPPTYGSGSVTLTVACTQPKCQANKGVLEINDNDVIFRFLCHHGGKSHYQGVSMRLTLKRAIQRDSGFLERLVNNLLTE